MKYIFIFILISQLANSQIKIVRVHFSYKYELGRSVDMFFINDDLDKTNLLISNIKVINESDFLSTFGIPLVETNYNTQCNSFVVSQQNEDFLKKSVKKHISTKNFEIEIEVSNLDLEYCEFTLNEKYWVSYNLNFKKAAMITQIIRYLKLGKKDVSTIKSLLKNIKNIDN